MPHLNQLQLARPTFGPHCHQPRVVVLTLHLLWQDRDFLVTNNLMDSIPTEFHGANGAATGICVCFEVKGVRDVTGMRAGSHCESWQCGWPQCERRSAKACISRAPP